MPAKITVTSIVCQFNLPPVKFNPQAVQSCRASKWIEETKLQNHTKKWEIGCHGANTTPSDDAKKTFGAVLLQSRWIYASGTGRQNCPASWVDFYSSKMSQCQAFEAMKAN